MHFHDGPRHSVAGDGLGQEKRRRMSESRFRGGFGPASAVCGDGPLDGEADVKAVMAVKIGETAMGRGQRHKSVSVRLQHSVRD